MSFSDLSIENFQKLLLSWGHKPAHAIPLLRHFYEHDGQFDFPLINIPKDLQRILTENAGWQSRAVREHLSDDGTTKFLIAFNTGGAVESVLMPSYRANESAGCLSSQIGCAMGCDFCASAKGGLVRNLSAGEIVEQYLHLRQAAARSARRLKTIVFMGMGEPMHNFDNVLQSIRVIGDPAIGGIGWRQITVSTVGIVEGIDRLAQENLNVHLAVSLHAPDESTRARIVPTARRYRIADIIEATRRFLDRTGRIPTIEYCMLDGVNDSDAQANLLADLLGDLRVHVNLIPYNWIGTGVSGQVYRTSGRVMEFLAILRQRGVVAHVRRVRGDDVSAACGQLQQRAAETGTAVT